MRPIVAVEPSADRLWRHMAVRKKRKTAHVSKPTRADAASQFAPVLEDVRAQFKVFGEALQGQREHIDRRLESVERQLGLLTDAVRTHSKELQRVETKLDEQERYSHWMAAKVSPRVQQIVEEAAELPAGELAELIEAIQSLPRRAEAVPERHAVIAERVALVRAGGAPTLSIDEVEQSLCSDLDL